MRNLIFIFCILIFNSLYSQNFEGKLSYKVDIEISPTMIAMGMTKEQMIEKMKQVGWTDSLNVYYQNGFYSSVTGDSKTIYRPDKNKLYTIRKGSDICIVVDASVDPEAKFLVMDPEEKLLGTKPTVKLLDTSVTVFNKPCKIVRVEWKTGYYDYYFSPGYLSIDPEFYKGHIYDGWYEFLKISKGLPLKIVKTTKGMFETSLTLKSIDLGKVDKGLFKLPKLIKMDAATPATLLPNQVQMKIEE